jgi:hypothetical protein
MMRDFHARVAKQIVNVALATPERWAHQVKKATETGYLDPNITTTYEEMKKFVAEGNYTKTVPNERHIQLEVGTFAASSYFSARLDTAQGTGRFGWLHYFRSPSLPYDGRPETSRRIQAEPNIPANLPASLVLTRSSDCLRSAMRLILFTAIRASIGAENLIPKEVNYTKITVRVAVMNKVQFLLASEPCKPLEPRSL